MTWVRVRRMAHDTKLERVSQRGDVGKNSVQGDFCYCGCTLQCGLNENLSEYSALATCVPFRYEKELTNA